MTDYPSKWLAQGRALVPVRPGSKIPAMKNWTNAPIRTPEDRQRWRGYSWGWALAPGDLVVDVDPRNGGGESLKKMNVLAGGKIFSQFPTVKTPRGGYHLYVSIPPGAAETKANPEYPGVDFLSSGAYVMMPGESSEYGKYSVVAGAVDEPAPQAPSWLLEIIARPAQGVPQKSTHETLTRSQLAGLLAQLPPEEYRTHGEWLPIMQAAHDATAGAGLAEFIEWSTSDPAFAHVAPEIESRWRTFAAGGPDNVTAGTLISEVLRRGGTMPQPTVGEAVDALPDIPADVLRSLADVAAPPPGLVVVPMEQLRREIGAVVKGKPLTDLRALVLDIMRHPEAERNLMLQELRQKSGYTSEHLRGLAVAAGPGAMNAPADPACEVADMTLATEWPSTDYIVHAADQQFWHFDGRHWKVFQPNRMKQIIEPRAKRWREMHPTSRRTTVSLVEESYKLLAMRLASDIQLPPVNIPENVLSVGNCELHLNPKTGEFKQRAHSPASWQTTLLPVEYHPEATCPRFDRFLTEIFQEKNPTTGKYEPVFHQDHLIDYVWEMIGYAIQPVKNIAAWCILKGEGSNGKSTFLGILSALLGPTLLSTHMAQITNDSHGLAMLPGKLLVIDDDLNQEYRLPDGFLKKVSENKILTANPKFQKPFSFRNTAMIWMCSNHLPMTRDLTPGMIRRAHIIEFSRQFSAIEADKTLQQDIIATELPGILAAALRGLARLRQRGSFDIPEVVSDIVHRWIRGSNSTACWLDERATRANEREKISMASLYDDYQRWCRAAGIDHRTSRTNFGQLMQNMGYAVRRSTGNQMFVFGISLRPAELGDEVFEDALF
jgi:P4 family phage/plasmid primase-like protien